MDNSRVRAIPLAVEGSIAPRIRLGLVRAEPVVVGPSGPPLLASIAETCGEVAGRWAGTPPGEIPGLAPARELYKAFGIDPTKTRPSSEALVRRILQGKPFPSVSNAVDLCNLCSVRFMLSLGLYDADAIQGDVVLRAGRPGDSYPGIRKDDVHLGGRPALYDDRGPFGNPTSDSLRTCVGESTRSLWMVLFAPAGYPRDAMERHVAWAADAMRRHLAGGSETPGAVTATVGW